MKKQAQEANITQSAENYRNNLNHKQFLQFCCVHIKVRMCVSVSVPVFACMDTFVHRQTDMCPLHLFG